MTAIVVLSFVMSALSLLISNYNRIDLLRLERELYRMKSDICRLKSKINYIESKQKSGGEDNA